MKLVRSIWSHAGIRNDDFLVSVRATIVSWRWLTVACLFVGIFEMIVSAQPVSAASRSLGSVLVAGNSIVVGQRLVSPNGQYEATLLARGAFVVENANFTMLWSNNVTSTKGLLHLTLQHDGALVARQANGRMVWSTQSTSNSPSKLELLNDGDLVLRTTTSVLWSSGTASGSSLPEGLNTVGAARQVIIVSAPNDASSFGWLTTYQLTANGWVREFATMATRAGVHGWLRGALRREGDGTTPIGRFTIGTTIYGNDTNPGTLYPYHHLVPGDYWDENPRGGRWYNTFRHSDNTDCAANPFGGASECLWLDHRDYPYLATINFNTPARGDYGSGIFLHVTTGSTQGCVSVDEVNLLKILRWLNPSEHPSIILAGAEPLREL
jgi:L,D-peptidoglycan transpeptidase YkuD (ErfK/YbiS/YcfS/YnhG family)